MNTTADENTGSENPGENTDSCDTGSENAGDKTESLSFQAEVGRLLDLMVHSVYSDKEVFLRELISNASDACDKLRYAALTDTALVGEATDFRVMISPNKAARTITINDNGIGMSRDELVGNLGTIARSGTAAFVDQLSGDEKDDAKLIGQFGVGFYSAFMIAGKVTVVSRKAGSPEAWQWESDGRGTFTIAPAEKAETGTSITMHLRDGEDEFLEAMRLRSIIKTYSDHIAIPVALVEEAAEGEEAKEPETVNAASALWTRSKSEITDEQYKEFYHHVGNGFDDPWTTIHWRAEGTIEYSALLFIPSAKPFDLFHPDRKNALKLYVKRVFITEGVEDLLPGWLRFLRGVVDSEDLPLNLSREMLQNNPVLRQIRNGLTRRVLNELTSKADKEPEAYAEFWQNFGGVVKEGLYEDQGNREALLKIARFRTTKSDGWVSLAEYVGRMVENQTAIYTIAGDDIEALKRSPQLEGFAAKGVEVLLLTDPVDEFWSSTVGDFDGKPFKSATRAGADLASIKAADAPDEPEAEPEGAIGNLIAAFKMSLGDAVKDVRVSDRLTDSACCLVSDENDMDLHLERMMRQHGQKMERAPRILELNPRHGLIKRLSESLDGPDAAARGEDYAWLLLDQARIIEGEPLPDPVAFAKRMAAVMEGSVQH
ncbi:MAG: molecular chaperone HtpG [Alphaproteobacteria bacterium]|jgi:molecular chaperone HtpG